MSAEATGARVEEILDGLTAKGGPAVAEAAEELVRALMEFYGAGLARLVDRLSGTSGNPLGALLGDELVAGLLVLHGLHPEDREQRVARALSAAEAGDLRVTGFDEESGELRLAKPEGGGCGCPSTSGAVEQRVAAALSCFAPEVTEVTLEQSAPREPALLQIGTRPPGAAANGPAVAR
ncbi:hypothetical protein ABZ929_09935 [Streptomyces physcomitrii]|uniref:hypothetical protein n=1 Tax=Streptomyces physcomitrii TaxID=2724184 RepID=UPI0033DEE98D